MQPGTIIADRFEIERVAGAGGMGTVYRARDRLTGGPVAVKVLHQGAKHAPRFELEASILAELRHPAIVRYLAHGAGPGGQRYLAIEWIEGEDLAVRLTRGPLDVAGSVAIARRVAGGLGEAHQRGIVHRDVKPENLVLSGGDLNAVKVLDFGIARLNQGPRAFSVAGMVIGTPAYMAPEQARGSADLDARADVFALGCVLFECLTGRPPFLGDHVMAVLAKILFEEAPRVTEHTADVPGALDDLVARMLAKDAANRPSDGHAVHRELTAIEANEARPRVASARPVEIGTGEQRLVSVVVAAPQRRSRSEIETSATVSLPVGAEALGAVEERLRTVVVAYGGQLELLADASVIATLSGTGAATDQAARAALCALAMRATAPEAPMALATGRAVVWGRWPVGEAIDRAASLLRSQTGGDGRGVRVDEVTAGLLDARFEIDGDEAGLVLRGRADQPEAVRKLLGKPAPFVGRDREIASLEAVLDECISEPRASAVLITGGAGSGKSRLRFELQRRLRERPAPVEVWIGRGDPMRIGSPFGLLASALRQAAAIRDGERLAVRQAKLKGRVARHVPADDVARVTEFLGEIAGARSTDDASVQLRAARRDATLMGDQMLRAWEDFISAECRAQPVVLALEDLHWGDLPTVRFVDAALGRLAGSPFLALALAREEVGELFPALWREHCAVSIQLGQLSRRSAQRMARAALGDAVPEATIDLVVERAGGNPFYLEELIRTVSEGKGTALPETVLAMVQARLADLDAESRRTLRAASVFGQVFWQGGLAALLGGADRAGPLAATLEALEHAELIERRARSKFPDDVEYVFRHGLVRESAYTTFTDADRKVGHHLAGAWLETAGERDAATLAEHFDRGGEPARAVGWFRRAAEQALEGHDLASAMTRAARGVACGARGEALGALELVAAEAHRWSGRFAEAGQRAGSAMKTLPKGGALWFRALDEAMSAAGRRGDYALAAAWESKAGAAIPVDGRVAGEPSDDARSAYIACLCSAARQLFHAGRYDEADAILAKVAGLGREAAIDPRALAEVHRLRGARARHVGDLAGDVAGYEQALAAFEEAGDARNAANARVSLGFAFIEVGDHEAAEQHLQRALEDASRMGLGTVCTRARQNLGLVFAAAGRLDEAADLERRAIAESLAHGDVRFEGWTRIYLANIALQRGDLAAAEEEARAAAELLELTPPARAGALASLARALLAQGRREEAASPAREAMAVLDGFGGIEEFEPLVRLAFAEVAEAAGDHDVARAAIAVARERLWSQAAAIPSASRRESFLRRVPENAKILAFAESLGLDHSPPGAVQPT